MPQPLGTIWTAAAHFYNKQGKRVHSCMDTPNSIAAHLLEHPNAVLVKSLNGHEPRDAYADRMAMLERNPEWKRSLLG